MATNKLMCKECYWKGTEDNVLKAPNPFDITDEIYGCPQCKTPSNFRYACEHEGCWANVSCGTPLKDGGYAQTCGKHAP